MTAPRGSDRATILDDAIRQFLCVADSENLRALTSPTAALELVITAAGSLRAALEEADRAGDVGGATVDLDADEAEAVSRALRDKIDEIDRDHFPADYLESARRKLHRAVAARATRRSAKAARFLGGAITGRPIAAEAVTDDSDERDGPGVHDEPKPSGRDAL